MPRILVFGDSVAYGRWDIKGGWADYLKSLYMEKNIINPDPYFEVYNLAVDGDDTKNLLGRFGLEVKQRISKDEETIIIFAIGINDSQFIQSKNDFKTSPEKFKDNICYLIKLSSEFASKVIFIGFTPVNESQTTPVLWNADHFYKNEYISKYNKIIKSICQENNIHFIDMFRKFNKLDYKKLLEDGAHPNSEGHQKIFEIVRDFLMEKGIIK